MKTFILSMVLAAVVTPAFAASAPKPNTKPEVFYRESVKRQDGTVSIRAVSENGKRIANIRVEKDGKVTGEVDGKKVNVTFDGI
jgi:hypothetical protein